MDLRKNLQVKQPNMEYPPEGNGWPEPLTSPSNPLRIGVTNGKNGESTMNDGVQTSQQKKGEHHLGETEGLQKTFGPGALSGPLSTPETYHGDPKGDGFTGSDRGSYGDQNPKTSQQIRGEHDKVEGE